MKIASIVLILASILMGCGHEVIVKTISVHDYGNLANTRHHIAMQFDKLIPDSPEALQIKNDQVKLLSEMKDNFNYSVPNLSGRMPIDADWEKPQWKQAGAIEIKNFMGEKPFFIPKVEAKMMYDSNNVYVIFKVEDGYVRSVTTKKNGPVYEDSCIEFFFSPDAAHPEKYFNLEINAGGTPLMYYNTIPREQFVICDPGDLEAIEIAHSLPGVVDPEISEPVTWTVEYRIPLELLKKYAPITAPGGEVRWKANFYKIADKSSNPHYMTWTVVDNPEPDFHLPPFFGDLIFN